MMSAFLDRELIKNEFTPAYHETNDDCLANKDILYILRIQRERFLKSESVNEDDFIADFQVNNEFLRKTGFAGKLMHPGPINVGMEIDESTAESEQSLILEQVETAYMLELLY